MNKTININSPKFSIGTKVYLRAIKDEDSLLVYYGKNCPEVFETLHLFSPSTLNQVKEEQNNWSLSPDTVLFTICKIEDDKAVGQTALRRIDLVSRAAVFYIALYDAQEWSKGYASDATSLMTKYSFEILNLNRIQLHVSTENIYGVKAYEKAGFKIEGTLRQAMYHHNRYVDFYVMGILREEYYSSTEIVDNI